MTSGSAFRARVFQEQCTPHRVRRHPESGQATARTPPQGPGHSPQQCRHEGCPWGPSSEMSPTKSSTGQNLPAEDGRPCGRGGGGTRSCRAAPHPSTPHAILGSGGLSRFEKLDTIVLGRDCAVHRATDEGSFIFSRIPLSASTAATLKSVNTREVTGERELCSAHTPPRGPPSPPQHVSPGCARWGRAAAGPRGQQPGRRPGAGTPPMC